MKTIGLSPKLIPACIACVLGLVLYLIGEHTVGLSVLLTGVGALGLGVWAPPGVVATEVGPASDDLLPDPPPEPKAVAKKKPTTRKKAK